MTIYLVHGGKFVSMVVQVACIWKNNRFIHHVTLFVFTPWLQLKYAIFFTYRCTRVHSFGDAKFFAQMFLISQNCIETVLHRPWKYE